MATLKAVKQLLVQVLSAYPQHTARLAPETIAAMPDVWAEMLGDLPDDVLAMAVRLHIESSQWLPSIAEIRSAAVTLVRQASPANQIAGEAWGEVKKAVRQVGYVGTPQFDNPATTAVVQRMGWRDICMDDGKESVLRAQFERMYEAEIGRMEAHVQRSPTVNGFISAMSASQVDRLTKGLANQLSAPDRLQIEDERVS